jgi:WD40 repeat protein
MPRRPAVAAVVCCALACLLAPRLRAAGPQFWRIEGAPAFLEGELTSVSVDSQGRLRLGAASLPLYDPAAPNAWSVARDARGVLYVGTGNDGRVLKVDGSKGSVLYDSDELEVHAVALGPDGRVYAATSPDGAVYAIDAAGKAARFFDPPDRYIWALAFDSAGNLYVGTGAEARVYRVSRDGKSSTLLTAADTHILSLAIDAQGRVFAGSAPDGIVYRVDAQGRVFVVLDSAFREIRALDVGEDGALYAAAVDARSAESTPGGTPAQPPAGAAAGVVGEVTVSESFSIVPPAGGAPVPVGGIQAPGAAASAAGPKGALLRIGDSGDVETLWSSTEDVPHSVAHLGRALLVGTGNKGKLYRVTGPGEWSLVAAVAAEQVTGISTGAGGATAFVTSNPARVYSLASAPATEGTFVSSVKDAEAPSAWGQASWEGSFPAGTSVQLQTRYGNTPRPDATWSDWSAPLTRASGEAIRAERARFLQLRVRLGGKDGVTPTVESIAAAYLQRNLPPELKSITVHPAGEVFQKPITVTGDPEILGFDPDPLSERASAARPAAGSPPAIAFSRKMYQRGMRTFSWQAEDANGDALLFDVFYRAIGDDRWRPLRRGLTEPVLAWDTSTVPNGRYVVRVQASDAPGNPPALALTGAKDSTSFEVDNTPPTLSASIDPARRDRLRATARDDSPIRKLELSIDAGRWEEVRPKDGISDSREEQYEIVLPPPPTPAPRIVILRATDILGNVSTVRVDVP